MGKHKDTRPTRPLGGMSGHRKPSQNNGCAVTALALAGGLAAAVGAAGFGVVEAIKAVV